MARALHIILTLDPQSGGPAEGTTQLSHAWNAIGHQQDVACFDEPGSPWHASFPGKVHALGAVRGGRLAQYVPSREAVRRVREIARDYDAVLVSGIWDAASVVARRALVGLGVPYFVYTHGMLDPWFRRNYPVKHLFKQASWLINQSALLGNATAVLFTTRAEMQLAAGQFWPYRVHGEVVGYGTKEPTGDADAQVRAFHAQLPHLADRRFILFLSRVHEKKGCDLLIEAFARLADRYPGDIVLAGPGDAGLLDSLGDLARRCGVADRVHFVGMVGGEAKWGAFHACDAFALTSHSENFGVAVVEAMACRKPVLITDKVNIWQEIAEDEAGLIGTDTLESSVDLLGRFIAMSPADCAAMGERGRASFFRHFEVAHTARRLAGLVFGDAAAT